MENYGAGKAVWEHFSQILGLTGDLLPVVSNPAADISLKSKMKGLGKTPSTFNRENKVVGISDWTSQISTPEQVVKWSRNDHLGICLQTRSVRAIDVDVPDELQAIEIEALIIETLGFVPPKRFRSISSKFLMLVKCDGDRPKQVVKTEKGIIEFLGTGQQCIVAGAHVQRDEGGKDVSLSRYEWEGGLPSEIPVVTGAVLDNLIAVLRKEFGVAEAVEKAAKLSVKQRAELIASEDPVVQFMYEKNMVRDVDKEKIHITCPFDHEHTPGSAVSSTTYLLANFGGHTIGNFSCLHGHCLDRKRHEFLEEMGYEEDLGFEDETVGQLEEDGSVTEVVIPKKKKFEFFQAAKSFGSNSLKWHIKGYLPKAELGVMIGASASGKTFALIDMVCHVAQGKDWQGRKTTQSKVAYIVAEGKEGFTNRVRAYALDHDTPDIEALDLFYHAGAPSLMSKADVKVLIDRINEIGGVGIIVVDTFARMTTEADENSAKDVGIALDNCRDLHVGTGATIVLAHHFGKDEDKGGRGSTALKAAADVEWLIKREMEGTKPPVPSEERTLYLSKMKDGSEGMAGDTFGLSYVCTGVDEEGTEIISCALDWGGL
jgi:hypothetical protein